MELSVLIPARNEPWLRATVEDVLRHSGETTEVIVVLDGAWADQPLTQHPRLQVIYLPTAIGQRAATNLAARVSTADYVMKLDAHCAVAPGFDRVLVDSARQLGPDVTQIPRMYNLHVFDWVCPCGHRWYQGPVEPCPMCKRLEAQRVMVWQPRWNRRSDYARFDATLHFQYWSAFGDRPASRGEIADTLCHVGAGWFMARARYWELGGLDEGHGSWGQMGVEVSCKTWLSGGRQVVNKKTWYSHLFRTRPGFSFPYTLSQGAIDHARAHSRRLWLDGAWPGARHSLRWLLEKFWPVPGWTEEQRDALTEVVRLGRLHGVRPLVGQPVDEGTLHVAADGLVARDQGEPTDIAERALDSRLLDCAHPDSRVPRVLVLDVGLVYYTDGRVDPAIGAAVCARIAAAGLPLVAVTCENRTIPIDWLPGAQRLALPHARGVLTMFRQILAGLESLDTEFACLVEHDVLYAPDHFTFRPPTADRYYYNVHTWCLDMATGRAVFYRAKRVSGLCASRELLIRHYRERVRRVAAEGWSLRIGFEPGSHRRAERVDDVPAEEWRAAVPNIDLRHGQNLTPSRWSPAEFRDRRNCQEWTEAKDIPGWGPTSEIIARLHPLVEVA